MTRELIIIDLDPRLGARVLLWNLALDQSGGAAPGRLHHLSWAGHDRCAHRGRRAMTTTM
jgi:hypothetical protein